MPASDEAPSRGPRAMSGSRAATAGYGVDLRCVGVPGPGQRAACGAGSTGSGTLLRIGGIVRR